MVDVYCKASEPSSSLRRNLCAGIVAVILVASSCSGGSASLPRKSTAPSSSNLLAVPAVRDPLTTDPLSPVAHDTETDAIVAHSGRLFASTDQWEYPGPSPAGQILVKESSAGPWKVFEQTQALRVEESLASFAIPDDQGLGSGHSLLITHAVVNRRSELQWLLDGASSFTVGNSFELSPPVSDVRSFGAHESAGVWAVYAGVEPTGILRGTWSPTTHSLRFDPTPELTVAPPGSSASRSQKVTGFADCSGALYTSIGTKLLRRNEGNLAPGVPRWVLVYQGPPVGAYNSGLRGLTCITHSGSPSLLFSTEGNGNVYRLDHLPGGQLTSSAPSNPTSPPGTLVPTLEFTPTNSIGQMLATQGTTVPAAGKGSITYVIAAYNNFATVKVGGTDRQAFGFEWAYQGACPRTRICGPTAFGAVTFDAAACFAVRTDNGRSPTYALHCLGGPDFTPSGKAGMPIRSGEAFVSIRTIEPSPFGESLYYGGYDCNFYPADGTAWIATSTLGSINTGGSRAEDS